MSRQSVFRRTSNREDRGSSVVWSGRRGNGQIVRFRVGIGQMERFLSKMQPYVSSWPQPRGCAVGKARQVTFGCVIKHQAISMSIAENILASPPPANDIPASTGARTLDSMRDEARALRTRGRFAEAVERLAQALKRSPADRSCHFELSLVFLGCLQWVQPLHKRTRLAEFAAVAGRGKGANEIPEDQRWADATSPMSSLPLLVVVASVAIMGLAYLDWQSLKDTSCAGAMNELNGPWRAIQVIGRAHMYVSSCAAALWWIARSTHRLGSEQPESYARGSVLKPELAVPCGCGEGVARPKAQP